MGFYIVSEKDEYVVIRDDNIGRSITNEAEKVCALLWNEGTLTGEDGQKRLYYYDTEGDVAELVHEHGLFIDIAFNAPPC